MSKTKYRGLGRRAPNGAAFVLPALALIATLGAAGCDVVFGIRDGKLRPEEGGSGGRGADGGGAGPMEERDAAASIATDTQWSRDVVWRLRGTSVVKAGATLSMQEGTQVLADLGGVLIVEPGAKIRAMGTRDAPIVFTSSARARRMADWGGVVLCGRARINTPGGRVVQDDLPRDVSPECGGEDDDDSSGELHYVRIEFAGQDVVPQQYIAGLELVAVGRGTAIDHLEILRAKDDGVYARGGAVNLKQVVVVGGTDDGLDWENGWRGDVQFFAVLKDDDHAYDSGIEGDSEEVPNAVSLPISNPRIFNATLIGKPVPNVDTQGIDLSSGTEGKLSNLLVYGFMPEGLDLDDQATFDRAMDGSLDITHSIFANEKNFSTDPSFLAGWATQPEKANLALAPGAVRIVSDATDAPDFSSPPGSPALTQGIAPPDDGFFDPTATFAGVCGTSCDELKGWTAFPRE